jgi:hypothetical protein
MSHEPHRNRHEQRGSSVGGGSKPKRVSLRLSDSSRPRTADPPAAAATADADRLDGENLARPLVLMGSGDGETPESHRRDLARQFLRPLRRDIVCQHLAQRKGEESEHRFWGAARLRDENERLRDPRGDVLTRRLA